MLIVYQSMVLVIVLLQTLALKQNTASLIPLFLTTEDKHKVSSSEGKNGEGGE